MGLQDLDQILIEGLFRFLSELRTTVWEHTHLQLF